MGQKWGAAGCCAPTESGTAAPPVSAHVYCGQTVAHLSYCWVLLIAVIVVVLPKTQLRDYLRVQCGGHTRCCKVTNKSFHWRETFPDISPTFGHFRDISLTAIKLPGISSISRQGVTLHRWLDDSNSIQHVQSAAFSFTRLGLLSRNEDS